ncbi:MAG TPA: hypothetical protein VM689_08125 [Aliidongia sp.]|nr:hypothetical protein [Aliidongia sp.]
MSYEFGSGAKQLNFPNPLKVHNLFLLAAAAIVGIAAIALLLSVRSSLTGRERLAPYEVLILAGVMVAIAITCLYACLAKLRFYFGRGRPESLAELVAPDQQSPGSPKAHTVRETLRQQALEYAEPRGPIAGLLFAIVPNLIYAPPPLRTLAEWQFRGALTLLTLLLSLGLTLLIGIPTQAHVNSAVIDWVGAAYIVFAIWILARPSLRGADAEGNFLSVWVLSALILFAFVGPILLTLWAPPLPRLPGFSPFPHVFVLLIAGLAAQALFFVALIRQLLPPPPTAVSMVQDTWNLACSPALVSGEYQRAMQEGWREKIPNRRYIHIDPLINLNASAGAFAGEILEESQPFPRTVETVQIGQALSQRALQFRTLLDFVAVLFTLWGSIAAYSLAETMLDTGAIAATSLIYAVIFAALAAYSFNAAYLLWLRFDFDSRLTWLEMSGQYVSAQINQGNLLQSNLRATSSMVQVEGMTYRLWVAELHTVAFGKDSPRYIASMAGNYAAAESLTARLKDFAMNQATVASLGNSANMQRLQTMSAMSGQSPQNPSLGPAAVAGGIITPDQ